MLVYVREYEGEVLLCVANLSRYAQAAEIELSPWRGLVPVEMLGRTKFPKIFGAPYPINLGLYGFFWFLLREETPIEQL
jgi:maltose alpha-D-glucosyltransferase/alpha-amylase